MRKLKGLIKPLLAALLLIALVMPFMPAQPVYAGTVDISIIQGSDDVEKGANSHWSFAGGGTSAGYFNGTFYALESGLRFQSVNVPQAATITTAYLTLTNQAAASATVVNSTIRGEDADNAATFSDLGNYNARSRTTASVSWNNIAAWSLNVEYESPEIKTVIQEIVDRGSWSSGNSLVIFWGDPSNTSTQVDGTFRAQWTYEGDSTKTAQLHIEFSLLPEVTTNAATLVEETTATLHADLTSLGSYSPVYVYFQYGETVAYGTNTAEQEKTGIEAFSQSLTGLVPNTTYHFRAAVRYNTTQYNYGFDGTFITSQAEPGADPPDVFRIDDIKVFTNYLEEGDQLYVIAYRVVYTAGTPILDITDYFDFQLLDGTVLKAQVPIKSWDYKPGSIYLAAASAPPWGGLYSIKIIGAPEKWNVPPTVSRTLTPGDWQGEDFIQLDTWVWSLAESLQNYYDEAFIEYLTGRRLLSDHGGYVFDMGIHGLSIKRPRLFSLIAGYPDIDLEEDRSKPREEALIISSETRLGPYFTEKLEGIAAIFGDSLDAREVAGVGLALLYLVMALTIGAMAGNMLWGLSAAILVLGAGAYFGLITLTMIGVIAFISVIIFMYQVFWKRT